MASTTRSRRSRAVPVALLSGIALALVACGPDRRCVDENNAIVDQTHCQNGTRTPGGLGALWYYGGHALMGGRMASGGSFTNPSDSSSTTSNAVRSSTGGGTTLAEPASGSSSTGAVSRGGLGSSASSVGSSSGS